MFRLIFPQALKESAMMRTGKATAVQDKLEHVKSMQNAIKEAKYDDFWRYNEELGEHSLDKLKFFPVRVVINQAYHPFMSAKEKKDGKNTATVIQRPFLAKNKDICIGEYLARVLPKYFHIQTEVTVNEEDDEDENSKEEEKKSETEEVEKVERTISGTEVIVNGIPIDLDISLTWLVLNMTALDNFLYVTIRVPRSS